MHSLFRWRIAFALWLPSLCLTITHAQFGAGSFTDGVPFAKPTYTVQPTITTGFQALENQLDSQGSERRLFIFPYAESIPNPDPTQPQTVNSYNIYARDTVTTTLTYDAEVLVNPGTANGFLTQINEMGSLNFRYYGGYQTIPADFSDPLSPSLGESSNIFIKNSAPTTTYSYELNLHSDEDSTFLALLNSKGQSNWLWVTSIVPDFSTFTNYDLFVRKAGQTNKYTYRLILSAGSESPIITEMNLQGNQGYRWLGVLSLGSASRANYELFVKDDLDSRTYQYKTLSAPADVDDFIAQVNTEGESSYSFQIQRIFDNSSAIRNLYVTFTEGSGSEPCPPSIGKIDIDSSGTVSFIPNPEVTFARYQLYRSEDLRRWETFGEPRSTATTPIRWPTTLPTTGRVFYRVVGIPFSTAP